nr:hypothetical protein [Tanacetum cinerariifolium]
MGKPVNDVLAQSVEVVLNSLNDSPSISETSSQSPPHINHCCYECGDPLDGIFYKRCTCKSCGKDAHIGYNCSPTVPVSSNSEPCNNQTIDELPQTVTHDAYQCQPTNEVYYYGQNSCYDSTSIGFDQSQPQQYTVNHPIFNAHNDYLDSQIQLNSTLAKITEQMTSITSLYEFIKSSVENLISIPSESEGIPKHMCDVPIQDNSPPLDVSKDQFEDFSESNKEFSSIDGDSFSIDDIDYVKASPPDSELVSSEVMEIVIPEVGGIDDDILLTIKDDILREKLLNVNLLIAKVKALNANPTPSFDCQTKSPSTSLNSLLEETNTFDNSLPEFETFCFDVEEIISGSTTTHSDISLPEYEAFYDDHVKEISSGSPTTHSDISLPEYEAFYDDHVKEISSGSPTTHSDSSLYASFIFDISINPFPPADMSDFFMSSPMNSFPSYRHQSMIVSFLRLNQTRRISPRMWWRIFLQQKNHKFLMLCPPIPPFN